MHAGRMFGVVLGLAAVIVLPAAGPPIVAKAPAPMLPLKEFMAHVLQRNAMQLWSWTAYISDEHGDRYTRPTTDEQWQDAESDALTVVELGDRLKISDRRLDRQWAGYVNGLQDAARQSADAAEAHDFDRLLRAGDALNARCVACHLHYVPDLERGPEPAAAQGKGS